MKISKLFVLSIVLFSIVSFCFAEIPARVEFLEKASLLNEEAALAFANSLTNADWYEADSEMLMESFNAVLEARKKFPWGRSYSDEIWLQYVVPARVDDEPLQPYRSLFLNEMSARLDSLSSLARAAIEVNLYLGERVGFVSTDWRDQGPLTTLSCGFGRCGELMIMAIDAMRSVGIPARGVYVPFWSASDNNHAWIEVYTEDGWKYMGACEPSTSLNNAWFNQSVFRAGILLTKDRTHSADNPNAVKTGSGYALNVTENYVPPANLTVDMPESWGEDDRVWFSLFNFGTLRPLIELMPKDGVAQLEIGHGDFVLMGIFEGELFFQPFTAQIGRATNIELDVTRNAPVDFRLTYPWPPLQNIKEPDFIPQHRIDKGNVLRHERDAKRSWNSDWLERFINEESGDYNNLFTTLKRAPGNEAAVMNAVLDVPEEQRENAIFIVSNLSSKDLRDVPYETLKEWVKRTPGEYADNEELKPLVLDPQIGYEYPSVGLPTSYKTKARKYKNLKSIKKDVDRFASQIDTLLRQRPLPPITIDNMISDGLKISSVSGAIWWTDRLRRAGIPAKTDPFSDWLEFYYDEEWLPLFPDNPDKLGEREVDGGVADHYKDPATVTVEWKEATSAPVWESEFLIMPIKESGLPDFRFGYNIDINRDSVSTIVKLAPGTYIVTAGRRNGRGDVSVSLKMLELTEDETKTLVLDVVPPIEPPSANGMEVTLNDLEWKPNNSGKMHLLVVLGDNEPSKRTRTQAIEFESDKIEVNLIDNLDGISEGDKKILGLTDRDEAGTPYVFFFDEDDMLLFTQSGYDLNLPNRMRNALR
jgi:Transglutaminase-like superfamily